MAVVEVSQTRNIATLSINRPEALNALNEEVLMELRNKIISLENVQVMILRGAGEKAFAAGADIKSIKEMNSMQAGAFVELGQSVVQLIEEAPFISIAAVNGFALGGGLELALSADLIYSTDKARFGAPETNLALIPGFGGTVNLIARVGFHHAMEFILRGHQWDAAKAKERGLVLEAFPEDEFTDKINAIAEEVSQKEIYSLLAARRLVRSMTSFDKSRAYLLERESFSRIVASGRPQEGIAAFLEKRTPQFSNHFNQEERSE